MTGMPMGSSSVGGMGLTTGMPMGALSAGYSGYSLQQPGSMPMGYSMQQPQSGYSVQQQRQPLSMPNYVEQPVSYVQQPVSYAMPYQQVPTTVEFLVPQEEYVQPDPEYVHSGPSYWESRPYKSTRCLPVLNIAYAIVASTRTHAHMVHANHNNLVVVVSVLACICRTQVYSGCVSVVLLRMSPALNRTRAF